MKYSVATGQFYDDDATNLPVDAEAVSAATVGILVRMATLAFGPNTDEPEAELVAQAPDVEPEPPAPPPPELWFYSPSTRGFYTTAIHKEIPGDACEISSEEHRALIEGQSDGRRIVADETGKPSLADPEPPTLASRRIELAALRYQRQSGGITVGGITVPTDRESASNITAAVVSLTQGLLTAPIKWKMTSGWVDLSQAQIVGVGAAVAQHVQRCFEAEAKVSDDLAKNLTIDIAAAFDAAYAALAA